MAPGLALLTLAPLLLGPQGSWAQGGCRDQDEVIGPMMEQQFGQWMSCAQLLEVASGDPCADQEIGELCCVQCKPEGKQILWQKFAVGQKELREALAHAPHLQLREGTSMPPLALGTSGLRGSQASKVVEFALRSGYRAVDTARIYSNHAEVGKGLRASGVPREEVWLTSKVWKDQLGYEPTAKAVGQMLAELETDYLDLCLIHNPEVQTNGPSTHMYAIVERAAAWRALEKARELGQCRHIGVSNYMEEHLRELLSYARMLPEVNQFEYHPYQVDNRTVRMCQRHGIAVQAYGSINAEGLLQDPAVLAVARETDRSPGQVLLRWAVQEGAMVLPKSGREERVLENGRLWDFALTAEQQARLTALHKGARFYGDPHEVASIDRLPRRRVGRR